jgi:hypothetical protein
MRRHGGRRTASVGMQLRLFLWRSCVQNARDGGTLARNALIVGVAGLLLGFLYEGALAKATCEHGDAFTSWPSDAERAAWEDGCRLRLASAGSFTTAPVFCFGQESPAAEIDLAQVRELSLSYTQAMTLTLLAVSIVSIQSSLNVFGAERTIFWRESRHYSVGSYLLGKTLAALPLSAAYPFLFLLPYYQLLRPWATWQTFYFNILLVQFAGEGVGHLISLLATEGRQLAGGVAALLLTVLSGSFPLLSSLPPLFTALSRASLARWGVEALYAHEYAPFIYGEPSLRGAGCCSYTFASSLAQSVAYPLPWNASTPCAQPVQPGSAGAVAHLLADQYGYTAWWAHNHCDTDSPPPPPGKQPDVVGCGRWDWAQPVLGLLTISVAVRLLVYLSLLLKDRTRRL